MTHSPTPSRSRIRVPFVLMVATLLATLAAAAPAVGSTGLTTPIYWGSWISGDTYGLGNAPFDEGAIDAFEASAGKGASIVHWGQPWYWGAAGGYQSFPTAEVEKMRARGSIPMISWNSWDLDANNSVNQPDFRLQRITDGHHDEYLRSWARQARDWGYPMFVRFNHEMNGFWYPWGETVNGNSPGQFAPMWRHVVNIFREEGATNVTWVWAPNAIFDGATPLSSSFPGNGFVDWVGISGYNWGTNPAGNAAGWQSFADVNRSTYDALGVIAPDKPVMIAETASTEHGGSKPGWIANTLKKQLPSWPRVKAFVWFNWNTQDARGRMDWTIESSPTARAAFANAVSSPFYAANSFGDLPALTKIAPPTGPQVPRPTLPGGAGPPATGGPVGTPALQRNGRFLSLAQLRRCRRDRTCLRAAWRSAPGSRAKVRYWIRVREAGTGRTLARRKGRMGSGKRRVLTMPIARRPRCGRVVAKVTMRASGRPPVVLVRRGVVRRNCISPKAAVRR